jgi:DNA polymerase III subunit beta
MKFIIERENLIKPLQAVSGVVERRQTLPILANILVNVKTDQLSMTATDLEVEMQAQVALKGAKPGEITLPARKFMDICRALPDQSKIEVTLDGSRAVIRSGKSRFVLATLPASEFPNIETSKNILSFSIPQGKLKQVIDRTHFAMAHQDVRYYLNGMYLETDDNVIRMVATDGHRLALCETEVKLKIKENHNIIIPRKGVLELLRLLQDNDEPAQIHLGTNYINITTKDLGLTSKLIDGRFPDYQNVVPNGGSKVITCAREMLRQALNRASILSNEKYRGIRLQFTKGILRIFAHNPEQEEAEEEMVIDYNGDDLEIGFNVNYLLDAITASAAEQVELALSDPNSCCLIHGLGEHDCKYVVMPMRL